MTNKKLGNDFEADFCNILFEEGFWVHNMAQNQAGQPADIIAVRDKRAYLIDCKVCSNDKFPLSRIEENQHYAMEHWADSGNGTGWFALKTSEGIVLIDYNTLLTLSKSMAVLNLKDIMRHGIKLGRWLDE